MVSQRQGLSVRCLHSRAEPWKKEYELYKTFFSAMFLIRIKSVPVEICKLSELEHRKAQG